MSTKRMRRTRNEHIRIRLVSQQNKSPAHNNLKELLHLLVGYESTKVSFDRINTGENKYFPVDVRTSL